MQSTTVTIIGAGQAGLAMSKCLTESSIDHVVLERSEVANSWRSERWDSLRLLTPNWLTRLPGFSYRGDDPDGYMTAAEVATFLSDYRRAIDAPVRTGTSVESVAAGPDGYVVTTDQGPIGCRSVVIATGACSTPKIPAIAADLPPHIRQLAPIHYRNSSDVEGRVLVVGASASGAQLADELARSGAEVTLAVGEHIRLPRTYRGMDIHWWMDTLGLLDDRYDEVEDLARARRLPSLQLVGTPEHRTLDLNALQESGVGVVGRLVGVDGHTAQFSGSLANHCASADLKLGRLLDEIDDHARTRGLDPEVAPADRPAATVVPTPRNTLSLDDFSTVVWATGFAPNYPWLDEHLLDRRGAIVHDGGVMSQPGMYALGLPFMRRRKSSFLDGVGPDAQDLSAHLMNHLDEHASRRR
ncbi:MAG TPA: NAD(P)-binding domain-containing protein [Acidimicrobiales bacterium]|nr:NAD(P)-binding domain-containing protein [Acidimicrobiales bacterium]